MMKILFWMMALAWFPVPLEAFTPLHQSLPFGLGNSVNTMKSFSRQRQLLSFSSSSPVPTATMMATTVTTLYAKNQPGNDKISAQRRKQLGIADDEDEYDLGFALEQNTDDTISKIVAGSFILIMIALLIVGVVLPSTTDYGEGICNPIQNAGRC